MCGIFGIIANQKSQLSSSDLKNIVNRLFKLSESRGKEAAGIAFLYKDEIDILKVPVMASELINSKEYRNLFSNKLNGNNTIDDTVAVVGHSRLVTNGSEALHENNQPVLKNGFACIHNGIIVNDEELWTKHEGLNRQYNVDTEIILALISKSVSENKPLEEAIKFVFGEIYGATSIAFLSENNDELVLATNNGSLYLSFNKEKEILIFASEKYILNELLEQTKLEQKDFKIRNVFPGTFYMFNFKNSELKKFNFSDNNGNGKINTNGNNNGAGRKIVDVKIEKDYYSLLPEYIKKKAVIHKTSSAEKLLYIDTKAIDSLQRCTKCVLPETFPFIEFDENGVCNICRNYRKLNYKGIGELEKLAAPYRSKDGTPDCLMAFSGGRDSSYAVHFVKKELKMNPLAYTYDWGMVTDIARRNISRVCGKLGIEHILLSADIRKKRDNIRKNILAWLKRPSLGTIPLFMAGDKQFFYFANKLQKQMNLDLLIFSMNPLERTDFKVGYCNINELENKNSEKHYKLSLSNKIKLFSYYGKEYILNPAYLNSTLADTLFGYFSYYMIPQNYLTLYDFIKWDENIVNKTLIEEYDWEIARDTKSTWRIGDGTASFYNYIYYRVGGFTEFDTFRSNQIREGFIKREDVIKNINADNIPREESIRWYCDTIGIDFEETIKRINSIPTRY